MSGASNTGSASGTSWSTPSYSSTPANPPGSGGGGPFNDGIARWSAAYTIPSGTPPALPSASVPTVAIPDLGIGSVDGLGALGLDQWEALTATPLSWGNVNGVLDAFAWAGDQIDQLADTAAGWIEDAGAWAGSAISSGVEVAGSFIAGLIDSGEAVLADLPDTISNFINTLSFACSTEFG